MDQTLKTSLIKKAKALAIFTIVYNLIEGVISVYFGIEENSVSLAGFGVDSFIEVFSAMIVFWKISGHETSANREKIALRGIGLLFMVLAVTTFGSAIYQLISGKHPRYDNPRHFSLNHQSEFHVLVVASKKESWRSLE